MMRTLAESIAAAELWLELTQPEKNASKVTDFARAAVGAGKHAIVKPVLQRARMVTNADGLGKADHAKRLAIAGGASLLSAGVAGKATWESVKKREGGMSRQQLGVEQLARTEREALENEGKSYTEPGYLKRNRALAQWAAEHPKAATTLSALGGAAGGGALALPWHQKYVMPRVKA